MSHWIWFFVFMIFKNFLLNPSRSLLDLNDAIESLESTVITDHQQIPDNPPSLDQKVLFLIYFSFLFPFPVLFIINLCLIALTQHNLLIDNVVKYFNQENVSFWIPVKPRYFKSPKIEFLISFFSIETNKKTGYETWNNINFLFSFGKK